MKRVQLSRRGIESDRPRARSDEGTTYPFEVKASLVQTATSCKRATRSAWSSPSRATAENPAEFELPDPGSASLLDTIYLERLCFASLAEAASHDTDAYVLWSANSGWDER